MITYNIIYGLFWKIFHESERNIKKIQNHSKFVAYIILFSIIVDLRKFIYVEFQKIGNRF